MGKIKSVKNKKGNTIYFEEDKHKYYDDTGADYLSTTRVIHSLFPEFNEDMMSYVVARKQIMKELGIDSKEDAPVHLCMGRKKDILVEWAEKRDMSCDMGNAVHRFAECILLGIPYDYKIMFPEIADQTKKLCKSVEIFIPKLLDEYEFISSEEIVFSYKYKLAGTVDLVMKNKKTGNICIFDWKTNKKGIEKINNYNKMGLYFLSHLEDCNFSKYSIQLNTYAWILKNESFYDFDNCEMALFHVNTKGVTGHVVPMLQNEVSDIIKYARKIQGKAA